MTIRALVICALVAGAGVATAAASEYSAERFDVRVEALQGGTLRVTETVRLRFESGSFTHFYREIPSRQTDGIEIVSASMDGRELPRGEGAGHVDIEGSSRIRVRWRFAPVSASTHVFVLTYTVRGVVRQENGADLLAWRLLPERHEYGIDESAATIELPAAPSSEPRLHVNRVGGSDLSVDGARVRVDARAIRRNGWIEAWIVLPRGSVIAAAPDWQQRSFRASESSMSWIIAAGAVLLCGLAVLFGVRQGYDPPPRDPFGSTTTPGVPENLAPALAGALVANGSPRLEHAMAALFSLAERGELTIEEQPRSFGQRQFKLTRTSTGRPLADHERRALDIAFDVPNKAEQSVTLGKARNRLVRHFRTFSRTLEAEMESGGLLDAGRRAVRARFGLLAVVAFIAAAVAAGAGAIASDTYGGWPMLIALALAIVAVTALICYGAHTPLSNDAVRRAQAWRGFKKYLRELARDRATSPAPQSAAQLLPFAVTIGLAPAWASYLKHHRGVAPPWFRAVNDADSNRAFAAFVGTGGAGHGGGAHGGGGGAAGGGASGAG